MTLGIGPHSSSLIILLVGCGWVESLTVIRLQHFAGVTGWPSHWALAHILVYTLFQIICVCLIKDIDLIMGFQMESLGTVC